jgi:hypothetical protein
MSWSPRIFNGELSGGKGRVHGRARPLNRQRHDESDGGRKDRALNEETYPW